MLQTATNENFKELISAKGCVIVDFWAEWCGPCRMLSPTVDQIANEYDGKVSVVKCNIEDCEDVAVEYGIRSIPTLLYFKDGVQVDKTVGLVSKANIVSILSANGV